MSSLVGWKEESYEMKRREEKKKKCYPLEMLIKPYYQVEEIMLSNETIYLTIITNMLDKLIMRNEWGLDKRILEADWYHNSIVAELWAI